MRDAVAARGVGFFAGLLEGEVVDRGRPTPSSRGRARAASDWSSSRTRPPASAGSSVEPPDAAETLDVERRAVRASRPLDARTPSRSPDGSRARRTRRASATICRTVSRTAWSASDSGDAFGEMSASRRGGRSAIAKITTDVSSGGIAVSGSTETPAPAATRSAMSRMPSTSTGTGSVTPTRACGLLDLDAQRVARGRQHERQLRQRLERHRVRRQLGARRREPDEVLVHQVLDREPLVAHRLGDDGLRQLLVEHLGEQPLGRALVDAQLDARARARGGRRRARGRASGSRCRRCRSWRCRPAAPGARRRPRGAAAARAGCGARGSSTTWPDSVGVAPERPRASSVTPSSASSWRTCSETFDCTVRSMSAAAVNVPSSSIAISVSRWRSSMAASSSSAASAADTLRANRICAIEPIIPTCWTDQRRVLPWCAGRIGEPVPPPAPRSPPPTVALLPGPTSTREELSWPSTRSPA